MARFLVSPERNLYIVDNKDELSDLCRSLELGWKLAGNLRQLCNWEQVGQDRSGRYEASNWQLLANISWLRHESSSTAVPIVGKQSWMLKVPELKGQLNLTGLQRVLAGQKVKGWSKLKDRPAAVAMLSSGASLLGLSCIEVSCIACLHV